MQQIQQKPLPEDARYNMLHELGVKKAQFNTALAQALGLSIEAVVSNGDGAGRGHYGRGSFEHIPIRHPGQSFQVSVRLADQGTDAVDCERCPSGHHSGQRLEA